MQAKTVDNREFAEMTERLAGTVEYIALPEAGVFSARVSCPFDRDRQGF